VRGVAGECAMEPAAPKRTRTTETQAGTTQPQCRVANESGFAPLTPSRSDTPGSGRSSGFSPASEAEQEAQLARATCAKRSRRRLNAFRAQAQ
jgi:hypothetical protein